MYMKKGIIEEQGVNTERGNADSPNCRSVVSREPSAIEIHFSQEHALPRVVHMQ